MKDTGILIRLAERARRNAYAPYSHFLVGAALITSEGKIFTGCNVENASLGLSCCAERNAVFRAAADGHRKIDAIAIVGGTLADDMTYAFPCGACRQVLAEFSGKKDMEIIVAKSEEDYLIRKLSDLLPDSFELDQQDPTTGGENQ